MGSREGVKKLTLRDWVRILGNALVVAEEKRANRPSHDAGNNFNCPFYLIPRKPEGDAKNG